MAEKKKFERHGVRPTAVIPRSSSNISVAITHKPIVAFLFLAKSASRALAQFAKIEIPLSRLRLRWPWPHVWADGPPAAQSSKQCSHLFRYFFQRAKRGILISCLTLAGLAGWLGWLGWLSKDAEGR